MSDDPSQPEQFEIFETHATKSLLDQLLADSRLYTKGK